MNDRHNRAGHSRHGGTHTGVVGRGASASGGERTDRTAGVDTPEQVDWSGWLLVGTVVFSLLVSVLYIPETQWLIGRFSFSQRQAYVLFPMLPAVLLGLVAV